MITRVLACVLVLSCATAARAESDVSVADRIQRGESRYSDLEFRAAVTFCSDGARDPSATEQEQARGWRCVGLAWLALDQKSLAREAFGHVFKIDSAYVVDEPSLSPRQRAFIEEVRKEFPPPPPPKVEEPVVVTPPPPPPPKRTPVYKRWYLWTPIALVLVGAGVGVGLGLGLHHSPATGTLPPGVVSLGLRVGW